MDSLLVSCTEQLTEINGQVEGTIPEWLSVQMLRVGPAKWDLDDFVLNHWLDGCAMLCKFTINKGQVKMNTKYLHSEAYNKMVQVKRPVFTEFGTRSYPDPCKNVFSRFLSQIVPSDLTDNGCVGIFKLANEYYSSSETCNVLKLCNHSLNVQQKINLDKVAGVNLACSHVQSIKGDEYAYNMSSSFLTGLKYHVLKIPLFKNSTNESKNSSFMNRASILGSIPSSWKTCIAYYHSFAITVNYLVFIELPLVVNAFKLATCTAKGKPLKDCLEWHPSENTRFHVICKRSGQVVGKYYAQAFFYFHTINSYEENGHIVTDLMAYEDPTILEKWDLSAMRSNMYDEQNQATPTRFVMPLHVQPVTAEKNVNLVTLENTSAKAIVGNDKHIFLTPEKIGRQGFELPTINYRHFNGYKYRFCYGSGVFERGFFENSICKLDVLSKEVLSWKGTQDQFPGECLFVPRPGATEEDDGVLLSVVLSADETLPHFVLILDGQTFTEIARANLLKGKGQIPPTIHGVYTYLDELQ